MWLACWFADWLCGWQYGLVIDGVVGRVVCLGFVCVWLT